MQRSSTVGTINIIYTDHALALRTAQAQFVVAARAEVESRLNGILTLWAGTAQRLPQDEVEKKTDAIGNKNGRKRPKYGAHPAELGVAVHIADQQ